MPRWALRVTLVAADGTTQEVAFSVDDADRDKAPDAQRLTLRRSTERAPDGEDALGSDVRRLHRRRRPVVSDERAVRR